MSLPVLPDVLSKGIMPLPVLSHVPSREVSGPGGWGV